MVKPPDKFSSTEGETAYVIFEVTGDPAPKVEWFKVGLIYAHKSYVFLFVNA